MQVVSMTARPAPDLSRSACASSAATPATTRQPGSCMRARPSRPAQPRGPGRRVPTWPQRDCAVTGPSTSSPFYERSAQPRRRLRPAASAPCSAVRGGLARPSARSTSRLVAAEAASTLLHPALLDACFHVSAVAMDELPGADDGRMYLPIGVERYAWLASAERTAARATPWCVRRVDARRHAGARHRASRRPTVARWHASTACAAAAPAATCSVSAPKRRWPTGCTQMSWKAQPLPPNARAADGPRRLADSRRWPWPRRVRLPRSLVAAERHARSCRAVPAGAVLAGAYRHRPDAAADYADALARAARAGDIAGVCHLWPLARASAERRRHAQRRPDASAPMRPCCCCRRLAMPHPAPRVWMVTAGSRDRRRHRDRRASSRRPLAGLTRVAALEHPELRRHPCRSRPAGHGARCRGSADELPPRRTRRRNAGRAAQRLRACRTAGSPAAPRPRQWTTRRCACISSERGTLENLAIVPSDRRAPGPAKSRSACAPAASTSATCSVRWACTRARSRHLGSDCAGEIVAARRPASAACRRRPRGRHGRRRVRQPCHDALGIRRTAAARSGLRAGRGDPHRLSHRRHHAQPARHG